MVECMCCHRPIVEAWVCADCRALYQLDGPTDTWPAWARQVRNDEQAERLNTRHWREQVPLSVVPGIEAKLYD